MSCMDAIEECRANIRRIDAEMAAAVAEIQADATRRILEVYESHAQRRYRFSAGMAIYQMIDDEKDTTPRILRTMERPAASRPRARLSIVALGALADAPRGMRMADLARLGVAASRTEAGMRLAVRRLENEGLIERRGHIRLLTPAGVAEAERSGKTVRRSIEVEVAPATLTDPDASALGPNAEAAPEDVVEPADEAVVAEPPHVAVEPPPEAAIPEKDRRGTDQVFGKTHPLWEEVSEYARTRVREGGVPLSAGTLADLIRERYPAFEVDARNAPNRFVGMGFRRILWAGSSKVSYWIGDGMPDRLE